MLLRAKAKKRSQLAAYIGEESNSASMLPRYIMHICDGKVGRDEENEDDKEVLEEIEEQKHDE